MYYKMIVNTDTTTAAQYFSGHVVLTLYYIIVLQ